MFNDIGSKVKGLAVLVCIVGMVCSFIAAVCVWISDISNSGIIGLIILIVGGFISWVSTWTTYAIGEAADLRNDVENLSQQLSAYKALISTNSNDAFTASTSDTKTTIEKFLKNSTSTENPAVVPIVDFDVKNTDLITNLKIALENCFGNPEVLKSLLIQLGNKLYFAGKYNEVADLDKIKTVSLSDLIATTDKYISSNSGK